MPNDTEGERPNGVNRRVPIAALLRALLPALVATVIVAFFLARSSARKPRVTADGRMSVALVQKDSAFDPIPSSKGGASGEVLYTPSAPGLHLELHARSLPPEQRYVLEIQVDTTIYAVATYSPDARGRLTIDTTLTQFREGECVGANFDQPQPVTGQHTIKFRMKRDGSPPSGTMPGIAPSNPGAQLSCHGNGDGKYDYVLLENEVANFRGTAARSDSR